MVLRLERGMAAPSRKTLGRVSALPESRPVR